MKNKALLLLIFLVSFGHAGDNSQATFGDIKEVVYKLIIEDKKRFQRSEEIDKRLVVVERSHKEMLVSKNDEADTIIERFVQENKALVMPQNHK